MDRDPAAETAARGQRAALCAEFVTPFLNEMREDYLGKIVSIAAAELDPKKRTDAITKLSIALKVRDHIANGLSAAIEAGKVAERSLLKSDEIERLSVDRRRLLDIVP